MPEVSSQPTHYNCSADFELDCLIDQWRDLFPLHDDLVETVERTFYDSFDWRLYAADSTLDIVHSELEDDARLQWNSKEGCRTQWVKQPPRFVWDLPTGVLRSSLTPILEMRALLPQVVIETRRQVLKWLNGDDKTVLRVAFERNQAIHPDTGQHYPLSDQIRALPVRGYDKPLNRVVGQLNATAQLEPDENSLLSCALEAIGRQPLDYSAKLNFSLDPTSHSVDSGVTILKHLLATMRINEPGVRADLDSEFLHDFRVAVRRTRSALSQIKAIFSPSVVERFAPDFAWLGLITSPVRDLDVYLLGFHDYKAALPPSVQSDLDPLYDFLRLKQRKAQQQLVRHLDSKRYQKLLDEWSRFLAKPPSTEAAGNAEKATLVLANRRIWRIYRRILHDGGMIRPDTAAVALHDLRKQCKKLRYLMEFFQSLYPKKTIRQLIKILKGLQDNLGDYQDYEVQEETLKQFSVEMMRAANVPAATLLAMGILVNDLDQHRCQARHAFAERFADFESPDHQRLFATLFNATPKEKPAS